MDRDRILVLMYLVSWITSLFIILKKTKHFGAGCFIISTYIVYAVSAYLLYGTSYYYFNPLPLKLIPYIYLFVMLLIGLIPILELDKNYQKPILTPSTSLLNNVCYIFIFSTLIEFPSSIANISQGLQMMMINSTGAQDMYNESIESVRSSGASISNLSAIISNAFAHIGYLLTVYYATLPKKNKWIFLGLIASSIMKMGNGIALGQRGGIIEPLLVIAATFFLLNAYMGKKIKRIVVSMGLFLVSLLTIPIVYITISRFDNKVMDPFESTYYYLGISSINFNNYALDDGGIRYGDRTIPLFKRMVGCDNVPKNFFERRDKYPNLKINDNTFSTYVGDFAIDYGPSLGAILIVFLSLYITRKSKIRGDTIGFHHIIAVHFMIYMCVIGGIKLFPYADGGNLKIIISIILYVLFSNDYRKQMDYENK